MPCPTPTACASSTSLCSAADALPGRRGLSPAVHCPPHLQEPLAHAPQLPRHHLVAVSRSRYRATRRTSICPSSWLCSVWSRPSV